MGRRINRYWIIFCTGVLCLATVAGSVLHLYHSRPTLASYSDVPVIIIDPGHGGMDGGAIGTDGQIEKELNLSIALKLDQMLKAFGFQTILTRDRDISIHSSEAKTVRQQKTSDLKNRLKLLDDTASGILISIHQNKYTQSSAKGTQVFFGGQSPESEELAAMLQKTITGYLQPDNTREPKKATKDIYILHEAKKPAVMVECGFLSNPQEAALLEEEDYQEQLVFSICMALLSCLAGE